MENRSKLKGRLQREEDERQGELEFARPPLSHVGKAAVRAFAEKHDSDILFINHAIVRGLDFEVISKVKFKKHRRKNVLLVLVTNGGDADVAFRIARCLQDAYERFDLFVSGWCKSAGTLIAIGAHTIHFGEFGELGPLDVQVGKKDEIWEYSSGLDLDYALQNLKNTSFDMFETYLLSIMRRSGGRITFKTASKISALITSAYTREIAAQIEPLNLGETSRLMAVAANYGRRLNVHHENLQGTTALDSLVSGYSSHSFVIDFREAALLFHRVEPPSPELRRLQAAIGLKESLVPLEGNTGAAEFVDYVTDCLDEAPEQPSTTNGPQEEHDDRSTEGADAEPASSENGQDGGSAPNSEGRVDAPDGEADPPHRA